MVKANTAPEAQRIRTIKTIFDVLTANQHDIADGVLITSTMIRLLGKQLPPEGQRELAARLLGLLAETEPETWGQYATAAVPGSPATKPTPAVETALDRIERTILIAGNHLKGEERLALFDQLINRMTAARAART